MDPSEKEYLMEPSFSFQASVLAEVNDAVIAIDNQQRVIYLNPAAERQYDVKAADALLRPLTDIYGFRWIRAEDEALAYNNLAKTGVWRGENLHVRRDGTTLNVESVVSTLKDKDGVTTGLLAIIRDVTERKRAENAIKSAEGLIQLITDALPSLISYIDVNFRYRLNNKAYESWFGQHRSGMTGKHVREVLGDAAWNKLRPYMETAISGRQVSFEEEIRYKDAGTRWINATYMPHFNAYGNVEGFAVLVNDVTKRNRAGERLREQAELLELAHDAIIVRDLDSRIQYWNTGALQTYGWTAEVAMGQVTHTLLQTEFPQPLKDIDAELIETGRWQGELKHFRADGQQIFVSSRWALLRDPQSKPLRILEINRDITLWKRLEAELRESEEALKFADRRKDEFLATLAHELRNPLAPIRNGLEIMRLAGNNAVAMEQARDIMERQLEQMVRLIDDLFDLSRISRGKIGLKKEIVDLGAVVRSAIEASRPFIEQFGHGLSVNGSPEPIFVHADLTRLAQVFANLLNNAAKYTEPGGNIELTIERHGGEVAVRVKDNGIGIPSGMLSQVFDMFAQVDKSLERAHGGLGIGLNITKKLVEMHGGTVHAHSKGEGMGSEFIVRLPVVVSGAGETAEARVPYRENYSSRRRRVIIADDNKDSASSMAIMLEIAGNEVRTACDGLEAIELAGEFRPDIMILDIGMPKLNGYETCRRIRQEPWGENIIIVALSGWGQDEMKRRSEAAGFTDHLVKPVDPGTLDQLLEGRKAPDFLE